MMMVLSSCLLDPVLAGVVVVVAAERSAVVVPAALGVNCSPWDRALVVAVACLVVAVVPFAVVVVASLVVFVNDAQWGTTQVTGVRVVVWFFHGWTTIPVLFDWAFVFETDR
jgi:hypothetical protein